MNENGRHIDTAKSGSYRPKKKGKIVNKSKLGTMDVGSFVMHQRPHADEICGLALILSTPEGKEAFRLPNGNYSLRFLEKDTPVTDAEWRKQGMVPIGCGGYSTMFNEHRKNGRLRGECASTLVANKLRIRHNPAYKQLLDETLWADTHKGCPATRLADIIKTLHRWYPEDPVKVVDLGVKLFDAVIVRGLFAFAATKSEKSLKQIFDGMSKDFDNKEAKSFLAKAVAKSQTDGRHVTELGAIVTALYRRGTYDEAQILEIVREILKVLYDDRVAFQYIRDEIARAFKFIPVQAKFKGQEYKLKLMVVRSDSPYAQKASRDLGANITLLQVSSGAVQVFTDSRIKGIHLADVTRMIRWLELPRDEKNVDWHRLAIPGIYDDIDWWYYFKMGEMLFNSSETHVAKITRIGLQALVEVLQYGFHPEGVYLWRRKHGAFPHRDKQRDERRTAKEAKAPKQKAPVVASNVKNNGASKSKKKTSEPAPSTNNLDEALKRAGVVVKPKKKTTARKRKTEKVVA